MYTRKQLKETETEETTCFFDTFLSLVAVSLLARKCIIAPVSTSLPAPTIDSVSTLVHNKKSVIRSANRGYKEVFHL